MTAIVSFFAGLFIGAALGVMRMSLAFVARDPAGDDGFEEV